MKYLNRLKSEKGLSGELQKLHKAKRPHTDEPQKLQKAHFYSYCSTEERLLSEYIPLFLPFFEADGNLVIPFGSDPRYHWWKGGQSVKNTIEEIKGEANA